jgi:translation initiation factor 1 (eIF-1/SUI1)
MSKNTSKGPSTGKSRVPLGDSQAASQSPFAGLAALKASLPVGTVSDADGATPEATPAVKAPRRFGEKVVVRMTKKGYGGKTVTVVTGVVDAARDDIMKSLKKALGTGARVDGDAIIVQGDVVDRVVAFVTDAGAKNVVRGS